MTRIFYASLLIIASQLVASTSAFQVCPNTPTSFCTRHQWNFSLRHQSANGNLSLQMVSSLNSNNSRNISRLKFWARKERTEKSRQNKMSQLYYKNGNEFDALPTTPADLDETLQENLVADSISIPQDLPKMRSDIPLPPAFDLPSQSGKLREEMAPTEADMIETTLGRVAMIASIFLFYQEIFSGMSFPDQLGL